MLSKKRPPKGPSRKTEQPASQPTSLLRPSTRGASRRGQSSKPATRRENPKNIHTTVQPKRHTRRSQTSPLREERPDLNKLTGKGKQKPKKSTLAVDSAIGVKPLSERQHKYREPDTLPSLRPLPSIETALETTLEGPGRRSGTEPVSREQQEYQRVYGPSSQDSRGGETPNIHDTAEPDDDPWFLDRPDTEDVFLERSGYVVPLSDESLVAIQVVLGRSAAKAMAGIRAGTREFARTLQDDRNVFLHSTEQPDPEMTALDNEQVNLPKELPEVAEFHNRLWAEDLTHCRREDEATFHRTTMMSLIDRFRFIFGGGIRTDDRSGHSLTFSFEKVWECEPMPTQNYSAEKRAGNSKIFTTRAKPDLCISFHTDKIISRRTWTSLPLRTRRIACHEGISPDQARRAFAFFIIEAKRSKTVPTTDEVRDQVLNAASQALHNIYEFFREADQTDIFFARVRVFSAAVSEQGIIIRAHRPIQIQGRAEENTPIVPGYPLQFEHKLYLTTDSTPFTRDKVVEAVGKIMLHYGERKLLNLLQAATKKIEEKLEKASEIGVPAENYFNHYRYGQEGIPVSNAASKTASKTGSRRESMSRIAGNQQGSTLASLSPVNMDLLHKAADIIAQSQHADPSRQQPAQSQDIPPASSMSMPPPNPPRSTQECYNSDTTEAIDQAAGESTLSQGMAELQTQSFDSQGPRGSQKRTQGASSAKKLNNPSKKPRIGKRS